MLMKIHCSDPGGGGGLQRGSVHWSDSETPFK